MSGPHPSVALTRLAVRTALQRTFSIGLNPGEIKQVDETFELLEQKTLRDQRALLGASLIRWLAKHRDALRTHYFEGPQDATHTKAQLSKVWRERTAPLPHDPGAKGRNACAELVGVVMPGGEPATTPPVRRAAGGGGH